MPSHLAAIALAGCAALAAAMGIGRFAFTPILPMMQAEGALEVAQGGWLASANYLGYLVGSLTAIRISWSPRVAIRAGLCAVGASTFAMGAVHSMGAWLALRAIAGAASAWILVFVSAWCLDQFESRAAARRAPMLGAVVFSGVGVGIALAGILCTLLLIEKVSADDAWIALGSASLAVAAATWGIFGEAAGRPSAAPSSANPCNADAVRLAVCYGAFGFGYIIPATFLSTMARDAFPDPAVYGWTWPLFGAAAAASTFCAAAWGGKLSPRALWIAAHVGMAAGVVIPLALAGLTGIIASGALVGGTFMVVTMAGMQEARRVAGVGARRLIAAMTSSFAAGQIVGPLLVSFLAARGHGFAPALALAGAVLAASAFTLAIHSPKPRTS